MRRAARRLCCPVLPRQIGRLAAEPRSLADQRLAPRDALGGLNQSIALFRKRLFRLDQLFGGFFSHDLFFSCSCLVRPLLLLIILLVPEPPRGYAEPFCGSTLS